MKNRFGLLFLIVFSAALLASSCGTMGLSSPSITAVLSAPSVDPIITQPQATSPDDLGALWDGDWAEDWPGSSTQDRYRITVSEDGYTISVKPITRPDRQNLSNLKWDGSLLSFTNYFDNRALAYELTIDPSGNIMRGQVTLPNEEVKQITWRRLIAGAESLGSTWPPPNQLVASYNMSPRDWQGEWEEEWPGSSTFDIYNLKVSPDGRQVTLSAKTNTGRQKFENLVWSLNRMTFTLRYGSQTWHYELVPKSATELEGIVTNSSGNQKHIIWRKFGTYNATVENWRGVWEEYWPNQTTHDRYEVIIAGGQITEIRPLTRTGEQHVTDITINGNTLTFVLYYGANMWSNPIEYEMTMRSPHRADGSAYLKRTGKRINLRWMKIADTEAPSVAPPPPPPQQPGATSWTGTWEEHWPGRTDRDVYRITEQGGTVIIQPVTNADRQQVYDIVLNGETLTFTLAFGSNQIQYNMTVQNSNTITGTVQLSSGNIKTITWSRVN